MCVWVLAHKICLLFRSFGFLFRIIADGTTIKTVSENVITSPGEEATLSCTVEGKPLNEEHVRWERIGYEMSTKTKTNFINGTSYLHIKKAKREDVGNFRCIADNRVANPTSRDVLLIVKCECAIKVRLRFSNLHETVRSETGEKKIKRKKRIAKEKYFPLFYCFVCCSFVSLSLHSQLRPKSIKPFYELQAVKMNVDDCRAAHKPHRLRNSRGLTTVQILMWIKHGNTMSNWSKSIRWHTNRRSWLRKSAKVITASTSASLATTWVRARKLFVWTLRRDRTPQSHWTFWTRHTIRWPSAGYPASMGAWRPAIAFVTAKWTANTTNMRTDCPIHTNWP